MNIALLICDHVYPELMNIQGSFAKMYQELLPSVNFSYYYVCDDHFPDSVNDHKIYMATGSHYSVYDDRPWIKKLKSFVKDIYVANKKYVGICFGHQMLAEALGGKVQKAETGWNVGVHSFRVLQKQTWMDPVAEKFNLLMMCEDQVTKLPTDSIVLSSNTECPVGMFTVNDKMLGIQAHPEFSREYDLALVNKRKSKIGDERVKKAVDNISDPTHENLIANWILNFLAQ